MKVLKQLFEYAGRHKYLTILSLVLSCVSAILLLMPFIYIWKIIEEIISVYPNYSEAINSISYGYKAFVFAVLGILVYVSSLLCSHLSAFRIATNMRKKTMKHVMKLPIGYIQNTGSGKVKKTIDEASGSTETYLAHQLPDMVQLITTVAAVIIFLFVFDWKFGIAAITPLILALLNMNKMVGQGLSDKMRAYQDALDNMSNEAVEYVRGIPVVKTFQQTIFSFKKFHKSIEDYENFGLGYAKEMRIPMTMFTSFINSIFIFLIGLAMILVLNGFDIKNNIMDFLFYAIFTPIITVTANKVLFASENTMKAADALARIHAITDLQPFEYSNTSLNPKSFDIEFENVSFRYPNNNNYVLRNISLKIPQGSTVAFVGESGSGKSTLVSLIPRFYDVDKGSIKIGGTNVKNIPEKELMKDISFVFQNSKLLSKSIYENIKMNTSKSRKDINNAIKNAQCEDITEKFKDGIYTKIGSKGVYVSGGEAQRLTVARAILKNSPIILLDEATAFSDPDNEYKMQKALEELSKDKTTIMIAHRLSTIQNADIIYVLEEGTIKESGSHNELIKKNGAYRKMWDNYQKSVQWKVSSKEDKK